MEKETARILTLFVDKWIEAKAYQMAVPNSIGLQ